MPTEEDSCHAAEIKQLVHESTRAVTLARKPNKNYAYHWRAYVYYVENMHAEGRLQPSDK
eukprot:6490333-Ditylum_brightwellii.AAC.1